MAASIGIILILGLLASALFTKLKFPGLLGMLLLGILLGPFVFDVMDEQLMLVSSEFRKLALIIILLRAGLGISKEALHKVGKPALFMSFLPGLVEGFAIAFASGPLLGFGWIEGGILGFIIAAVSPAVVVPKMIQYAEEGRGIERGIPTLILASASVDDVFAITLFSAFLGFYSGASVNIGVELIGIPVSIILGVLLGLVFGGILLWLYKRFPMQDTRKVLYLLGAAIVITAVEAWFKNTVEIAALLGVMAMGFIILEKAPGIGKAMAKKMGKIWIFAEILLFVLVGAQVNLSVALDSGLMGLAIITIGLLARSFGVWLALIGSGFSMKEKVFCMIAYWPKATVQAAIGGVPLALGVANGEVILAIAVLAILLTAPLGAVAIHIAGEKLLQIDI